MKNLKALFVLLTMAAASVISSCKKESANDISSTNHKVVFKVTTTFKTAMSTATYSDGTGKTETFTNSERLTEWTSREIIISSEANTVTFTAIAPGADDGVGFFMSVQIFVDGVEKAQSKVSKATNSKLIAATTYKF
jgi:hypothetical protein